MKELAQLKKKIEELEAFRISLDRQQLTYPIDIKSRKIILDETISYEGTIYTPYSDLSYAEPIEVEIDGKVYDLESTVEV